MPLFLRKCCPASTVENVELDPLVLQMAVRHFGFPQPGTDDKCITHISDAADFVDRASKHLQQLNSEDDDYGYDAIMVDLYTRGGDFPPQCVSEKFVRGLATLAQNRQGLVVFNTGRTMPGNETLHAHFAR